MVSKQSKLTKRQVQDRYERFTSPSRRTAPPPSCLEVESSSHRRTAPPLRMYEVGISSHRRIAPPPSRQEEASSDDSVEMWVLRCTAPPPLRLVTPPPSLTHLVAPPPPPPTRVKEVSSDDSPSDSSGYNDECPDVKEVSSYVGGARRERHSLEKLN
jgi:hypothetical protein